MTEAKSANKLLGTWRYIGTRINGSSWDRGANPQGMIYYGPHGDEELGEESPPGDDFLAHACVEWEKAAQAAEATTRTWRDGFIAVSSSSLRAPWPAREGCDGLGGARWPGGRAGTSRSPRSRS